MATAPDGSTTTPAPLVDNSATSSQDAATLDALKKAFDRLGLGGLMGHVLDLYRRGIKDSASIMLQLQDTDIYKKRFSANEARVKNGWKVLSPEEYIQLEDTYRQKMQEAGLPQGFYDQPEDFQKFMENNTAPTEVQERVNWAKEAAINADPGLVNALRDMYGVNDSDIVAYFLDRDRAKDLVERRFNAAQANAAAAKVGVQFSTQFAEELGDITKGQRAGLDQTFSGIRDDLAAAGRLNDVQQGDLSAEDLARSAFNMDGAGKAAEKRRRLASQERAAFSGGAAASSGALGQTKRL